MSNQRLQVRILGIVQGVGFRPFVFRLATELDLTGWVRNDGGGVTIEAEGQYTSLLEFLTRLRNEIPPSAFIYAIDSRFLLPSGFISFEIVKSTSDEKTLAWILPDLSICVECRKEILNPENRRYRYPFTNCTHCGPRFTIIQGLPYDRPMTTMKEFLMCSVCAAEYKDPRDRRFHAQPNACANCGPSLKLLSSDGEIISEGSNALLEAEKKIFAGEIIALKGIGGYQLILDARSEEAVTRLRRRKRRQNKPFAVMFPNLEMLRKYVDVPPFAEPFLNSTQSPIVLLQRTKTGHVNIAPSVAPYSPYLGVFLPYSPLHQMLLQDLHIPLIATSANITDEPIEFEETGALQKLSNVCDVFLTHNRPIAHHADDSVVQVITAPEIKLQMLRRARGYTPFPILAPKELPPLIALGGHLNSTFAISRGREIIISQHIGDLEGYDTREVFKRTLDHFLKIYQVEPVAVVHDLHPDYFTTRFAEEFQLPKIAVQHHHAHLAACALENQIEGKVLGLTWDGTGYGTDHTVWGGEFLLGNALKAERVASLFPFTLPGGERAIKQTWRLAISLLLHAYGPEFPCDLPMFRNVQEQDWRSVLQITQKKTFSPTTSSMGRLFDGVSALLGLSYYNSHQAEAAQMLEYAAWRNRDNVRPFEIPALEGTPILLDWRPMIQSLVDQFRKGRSAESLAASFHLSLVESAIKMIHRLGDPPVVTAGGVFCNRFLTEALLTRCRNEGIKVYIHSQLPPTDGSLCAGQLWVAAHNL